MKIKYIRILISGCILLLFLSGFIFSGAIPASITEHIASYQIFPALIKLYSAHIFSWSFVVILLLTLLFGRIYCSTMCPLGTVQDCVGIIASGRKRQYHHASLFLRYALPLVTVLLFIFSADIMLSFLEPYSVATRIADNIILPFGFKTHFLSIKGVIVSAGSLLILVLLYFFRGRIYCNSLCPAGALLSLFSRISLFAVRIDKSKCVSCRKCENVCKAECIDSKNKVVDSSKCVSCFNCISECKLKAVYYGIPGKLFETSHKTADARNNGAVTRRDFMGLAASAFASWPIAKLLSGRTFITRTPVTPPGSSGLEHFTNTCTACQLCVTQCPMNVLQPSLMEYGIGGIMQPRLDYSKSYCDFNCNICTQICPVGAILPLTVAEKKRISIGVASIDESICIPYAKGTACAACDEMCPTGATKMAPYRNNLPAPKVKREICIGCGACEKACPVSPVKAITVKAREKHVVIEDIKKADTQTTKKETDFAF